MLQQVCQVLLYDSCQTSETRQPLTLWFRLVQPWRKAADPPGDITVGKTWSVDFNNFDGTSELVDTYTQDHSLTETTDYSLTEQVNVSVNVGMNIEGLGDLGMSISADETEVKSKNTTVTTSHNTSFQLQVPAGEGRRVTEQTIETTQETVFECKVGVTGWLVFRYSGNGLWVFLGYDAPWLSEYRTASGAVTRTVKSTHITVTINQIDESGKIIDPGSRHAIMVTNKAGGVHGAVSSMVTPLPRMGLIQISPSIPPPNWPSTPYSITFANNDATENRGREFREFQTAVRHQFQSRSVSMRLSPPIVHENRWSSRLTWDPLTDMRVTAVHNLITAAYLIANFTPHAILGFH